MIERFAPVWAICLLGISMAQVQAATAPADVAGLAEEVAVLRAVKSLQPTAEQLAGLATAVTGAQERLAQQSQAGMRAIAALRDPVLRARQQLLPEGVNLNDPQMAAVLSADQQVTNAQRAAEENQSRVREEQTAGLHHQLDTLLTPAQVAAIVARGRAMLAAQRAEQDQQRQQQRQQFQQQAARAQGQTPGGPGAGGPGPGGSARLQQMMERMRGMNADQYQQMSRGMARRFGDVGTRAYQSAIAMLDQVRSMPDRQFRRQSAAIAQKFSQGMSAAASPANAAYTISEQSATDAWIQRYLLSPQSPTALKELAAAKSGG